MKKLKKGEAFIAAVLILIIAAAALIFVFRSDKESVKSDISQKNISAISLTGSEKFDKPEIAKKVSVNKENKEKEFITSFMLDAATYLKVDESGRYYFENTLNERLDKTEFLDDLGNRLSVYVENGVPHFMTDAGEVKTFLVNSHTVEILNNTVYINLCQMKQPDAEAASEKASEKTTGTAGEKTEKSTETKAEKKPEEKEKETKAEAQALLLESEADVVLLAEESAETKTKDSKKTEETDKKQIQDNKKTTTKKTKKTTTTTSPRTLPTTTTTLPKYNPIDSYSAELLRLINLERTNRGLSELTAKNTLDQAALARAKEISENFSHTRLDGRETKTIMSDYGLSFKLYGENIAAGQKSAIDVVSDWMSSDATRKNILNPAYKYFGSSHYYLGDDDNYRFEYWTACFYTPISEEATEERENPVPKDAQKKTTTAVPKQSKNDENAAQKAGKKTTEKA